LKLQKKCNNFFLILILTCLLHLILQILHIFSRTSSYEFNKNKFNRSATFSSSISSISSSNFSLPSQKFQNSSSNYNNNNFDNKFKRNRTKNNNSNNKNNDSDSDNQEDNNKGNFFLRGRHTRSSRSMDMTNGNLTKLNTVMEDSTVLGIQIRPRSSSLSSIRSEDDNSSPGTSYTATIHHANELWLPPSTTPYKK